jgi:hypothetical protein
MSDDLIDFGIAMFLLIGTFSLIFWDRHEWKKEVARTKAAQEDETSE